MAKIDNLGEFEQLALLAVMRLGEDAYGARIQEELEEIAGRDAAISAIYITLKRLEAKGMVSSSLGAPTEERGGKARRYFRVEPAGMEALAEARARLLSMWSGLEDDLEEIGSAVHGG
ncbi:MAG TPA: helix-turn-helix transcriptional regulator [Longimicrobiales bacterium]|nr:helix-turn-helix transcriptional regulator [Longimicrobiales bacterium]